MTGTKKGVVLRLFHCLAVASALSAATAAFIQAEPDLLVYPNQPAEFHYNPAEFEMMYPSHPGFESAYQIGGVSLWDRQLGRVAYEVFRAPQLMGIQPSVRGTNEYVLMDNDFTLIVDGFGEYPRQFGKVYVRFTPDPPQSTALVEMDGEAVDFHIQPIDPFNAFTPTEEGYYTGIQPVAIRWSGAVGIRITAYEDLNNNMVFDGGAPRWSIYVLDNSVPVEERTWGAIKAMYSSD